jgi:cathepsin C
MTLYLHWVLGLLIHAPEVFADFPVHCLRHEVVGEWKFILGALQPKRSSCGHRRPDLEEAQPVRLLVDHESTPKDTLRQLMVTLQNPNVAMSARDSQGTWTMIYDEGFR